MCKLIEKNVSKDFLQQVQKSVYVHIKKWVVFTPPELENCCLLTCAAPQAYPQCVEHVFARYNNDQAVLEHDVVLCQKLV